jgi:hypothetical protein
MIQAMMNALVVFHEEQVLAVDPEKKEVLQLFPGIVEHRPVKF